MEEKGFVIIWKGSALKILALPKIILFATILQVPQDVISELNNVFKIPLVDKVKRLKFVQHQYEGSLGMIDIESLFNSFKVS